MPDLPHISGLNTPATSWPGSGFKGGIPPTEWTQERIDAFRQQIIELILRQVTLALRGLLNPGKAFDQLRDWADNLGDDLVDQIRANAGIDLASWDAFVDSLNDGKGIDLPFVTAFISGVQEFFGAIDFTAPDFDPQDAAREFVRTVVQPFLNIVSQIVPALLGPLSIGFLTDEVQTLLYEGGFDDPITIVEGDGVTHDATDGAPGSDPLGCARVACDGTFKIRRTEPLKVGKDWVLEAGADVRYESVVAAAGSNAVRVEIVPYMGEGNPQAAVWMASDESPAGTEPWGPLNAWGSYTVPEGVTHVSVQWVVASEATGGVVKFDNVYLHATQKIPQGFTKDLPEDLASLLNFVRTWVESALTALGIDPSGNLIDDIFDLSDELEWIRDRAQQGFDDAAQALAGLAEKLSISSWVTYFGSKVRNGSNLAVGGDMDTDVFPDGFYWHPGEYSTEQAHGGSRSRKITKTGSGEVIFDLVYDVAQTDPWLESFLRVQPGQKYAVDTWVYPHGSNTGTQTVSLWGKLVDSTGVLPDSWPEGVTVTPGGGWEELSYTFTIPAGYDRWYPYVGIAAATTEGNGYYVDSVTIREVTEVRNLAAQLLSDPAAVIGAIPQALVSGLAGTVAELNQIRDILGGLVVTPINSAIQDIKDWWTSITGKTQNLTSTGQLDASNLVGQVAKDAVEGLTDLADDVVGGFKGIFDSWFGGNTATGTPAEVAQAIEAIRVAVYGGYIVETIVSDQTWTRPFDPAECLEFWAVPVGGGGRGQTGDTARPGTDEVRTVDGGLGGIDGGYNAVQLDPASIPGTVACTIGPAASTPGATGGVTSFGSLAQSVPGIGAISNGVGFLASASKPGRGGDGGSAFMSRVNSTTYTSSPGKAGEGSALAAGGAAGAANGGTGGAGATAPMDGERKAGGGGGGGGGGRAGNQTGTITGGTGGNGGFPGGASGGGGAAMNINTIGFNVAPGQPGTPANGCLFLIYKLASGDDD
ncbi:minor tail protein [Mycobacterium phage Tortellini]|uniref:Minor tail protein n=1 Tax=Mycobacterium phage Tortellini TaxID=1897497 RepID=A0A1D8EX10_9CAUD|nr:minor tail protein [Mycobacterium phage Tortellini]AOT25765.1 minor tail protein [Mycobacterium phage Tortellini]